MTVSLWQDSAQIRLAHNKHGIIRGSLFLHQKERCFVSDGNVKAVGRYLRETKI